MSESSSPKWHPSMGRLPLDNVHPDKLEKLKMDAEELCDTTMNIERRTLLKVTIEEFKTPNGNTINKKGIDPDIEVEDDKKTELDEQLQKAIEECKK